MAEREQPPPDFGSNNSDEDTTQVAHVPDVDDEDNNLSFEQPELEEEPIFLNDREDLNVGNKTTLQIEESIGATAAVADVTSSTVEEENDQEVETNAHIDAIAEHDDGDHVKIDDDESKQLHHPEPSTTTEEDRSENNDVDEDATIEISVSDPEKVGDGMSSYYKYTVVTKTNLSFFKKPESKVKRRFSDFLALYSRLSEKYIAKGVIVPPAPEKSVIGNTKAKFSEGGVTSDFVGKRRAALERYLMRTASHPILRKDAEIREFLENEQDLPHATNMSALSVGGLKRFAKNLGQQVEKMTSKALDSDRWFEEKSHQFENLELQLKKLYECVMSLVNARKDAAKSTADFAKACAMLSNAEENTGLSHALMKLADVEEKIDQLMQKQTHSDFYLLAELLSDYIRLLSPVKNTFHERVKVFNHWQNCQNTLTKKRESEAKIQAGGKTEKLHQIRQEIKEWEGKVENGQKSFEKISDEIKDEIERFEKVRVKEFHDTIIRYVESLLHTQQELITYWEGFIPEVQSIA